MIAYRAAKRKEIFHHGKAVRKRHRHDQKENRHPKREEIRILGSPLYGGRRPRHREAGAALHYQTIQSFYNKLAKEGREIRRKDKKGKITVTKAPMSAKSIKNIHGVLHKALQQAVLIGSLRFNPTEACTLPRQEKKELAPLDDEQIAAFLAAIQDSDMKTLLLSLIHI